jgi:hypothetical protein
LGGHEDAEQGESYAWIKVEFDKATPPSETTNTEMLPLAAGFKGIVAEALCGAGEDRSAVSK